MREVGKTPDQPTSPNSRSPSSKSPKSSPQSTQFSPATKTHRARLTSTHFESHFQTIQLPTPSVHYSLPPTFPHPCSITPDTDSTPQPTPNIETDENEQKSTKKSRDETSELTKRGQGSKSTQLSTSTSTKNHPTTTKSIKLSTQSQFSSKPPGNLSTYIIFTVTDFLFASEWLVPTFFRDITTQLSYISTNFHPQISSTPTQSPNSTSNSPTNNGHIKTIVNAPPNGVVKPVDRRYFQLLAQIYNRYSEYPTRRSERAEDLKTQIRLGGPDHFTHDLFSTIPHVAFNSIHKNPSLINIKTYNPLSTESESTQQNNKNPAEETTKKENLESTSETQQQQQSTHTESESKPADSSEKTPTPDDKTKSNEKPAQKTTNDEIPTITKLHCECGRPIIESCYSTDEVQSFVKSLYYEHIWIDMDKNNVVCYPKDQDPNNQPKSGGWMMKTEFIGSLVSISVHFVLITILFLGAWYLFDFLASPD